jgi:hypothetical protein
MGNNFFLYEVQDYYIDLNWKTEEKFNIGSKYQPSVYNNVDNTGIS